MIRERVREGVRAGIVAAAATAGVLIGFGGARGALFHPLNTIAHFVMGQSAYFVHAFEPSITLVALAIHVVAVVLWGILFALLAPRGRGWWLVAAGVIFAALVLLVDLALPRALAPGFETVLSRIELAFVYLVLGLALAFALRVQRTMR